MDYKINQGAYVNLSCDPCWQYTDNWKECWADFKKYPEVQFLFYVIASPEGFF